jgi:MYXO-CTERM domain-containing protein
MKRTLLAAATVAPLAVLAAIATAPSGMVVDLDNFNAEDTTSYINAAQCADTAPLNLEWSIVDVNGGLTGSGEYRIFASNTAPPTADSEGRFANFCDEADITGGTSPDIFAGRVDVATWTSDIQRLEVSGKTAADLADVTCGDAGESDLVYICAHLYEGSTKKGRASGQFTVQVRAPPAPTGVTAGPASETSLRVSWTASSGGVEVDHYVAEATAGAEVQRSGTTEATNVTISGLTEGTTYSVVVYAFSLGGNQSVASAAFSATPAPVDDFWETYVKAGGTDDGGCASGSAGPLALLAVGSLVLLRRRK